MPRKPDRTTTKSRIPKEITEEYLDELEMRLACSRFTVDYEEVVLARERGLGSWMQKDLDPRINRVETHDSQEVVKKGGKG